MNEDYELLKALMEQLEQEMIIHEFSTSTVKSIRHTTPKVSFEQFIELCQPGDIIVSRFNSDKVKDTKKRAVSKVMGGVLSFFQGMPFVSSKIITFDKKIAGYSVNPKKPNVLAEVPIRQYLKFQKSAIICRVTSANEKQVNDAVKYVKSRFGVPYDGVGLFKTAWNKFAETLKVKGQDPETFKPHQLSRYKDPLFCSTVISLAYRKVGVKADFTKRPLQQWPRNFLLSGSTKKIAKYEV